MRRAIVAGALLALGGCGGEGGETRNMSREAVAREVAEVRVTPGQWELTTQIMDVDAPNLPRQIVTQMQQPRPPVRHCITPEQADPQRMRELMVRQDSGCSVRDFTMRDGRMEGQMVCRSGTDQEVAAAMSGRYGPEMFDYRTEVRTPMPNSTDTMRLTVRTSGRRLGACEAGGSQ